MVDFSTMEKAKSWLGQKNRQVTICLTTRAGLRMLPFLVAGPIAPIEENVCLLLKTLVRSAVIGSIPEAYMDGTVEPITDREANFAFGGLLEPLSAALMAGRVANHNTTQEHAITASLHALSWGDQGTNGQDAKLIDTSTDSADIFNYPLWEDGIPTSSITSRLPRLREFWKNKPEIWGFWERWYDGFLNGAPIDWNIQYAAATLSNEDWEKGSKWIAKKIAEIERNILSQKTPLAETIEFNPETNRFHAVPLDIAKPDLVAATLSQLSDALGDVLAEASNGLTEKSREVRVVHRTLDKYGNDPQQIELNLVSVAIGLRRQIFETSELPKTEENLAFLQTTEDGAIAIRATHPDVAENREILARQKFVELSDDDKALLKAAQEPLQLLSEWQIADDFAEDIPELLNTSVGPSGNFAPSLPGLTRTFSRIAKISRQMDDESVLKRLKDTDAFVTAEITLVVGGVVTLMQQLVAVGLRLFGPL